MRACIGRCVCVRVCVIRYILPSILAETGQTAKSIYHFAVFKSHIHTHTNTRKLTQY